MSEWQPIQTVPIEKDVLVYGPFIGMLVVELDYKFSIISEPDRNIGTEVSCAGFTHWMPLPRPPE